MTPAKFRKKAERVFLKANPTAIITGWTQQPKKVIYPTGLEKWAGAFHAIADGYRPKIIFASGGDYDMWVR